MKKIPVKNMHTLNMLRRAGLINFATTTGEKIEGLYSGKKFTCYYIDEAIGANTFTHKGKTYVVEYVSGCFYPYVFQAIDL